MSNTYNQDNNANAEMMKYSVGQKICWQDAESKEYKEGTIIDVSFGGIEVACGLEDCYVSFEEIIV